jgi:putative permease
MYNVLKRFYQRHFTNPEAVVLALFLVIGFFLLLAFGEMLASVFTALVLAFVLEWVTKQLQHLNVPRSYAIAIVYLGFLGILVGSVLVLFPLLWQQTVHLIQEMPGMLSHLQEQILLLPVHYPELFSQAQVNDFINTARLQVTQFSQHILSYSTAFVPIIAAIVVYFILVPLMIFFMLKDKDLISRWFAKFIPAERGLVERVWEEVHIQLGNYVRGKVGEVIIVGMVAWVAFVLIGLNYATLLAVIVGVSVLVPYVGPIVATIPIALVGFFQWGWSPHFIYLILGYGVLQALDGNVLVPILFSEVVDLHPLAIIIAVIFFGALWGFWGVFFAIPLGILIKAVIDAWPDPSEENL